MAAGWIYVLLNDAFPHLIKIGMTTTSPNQRASELDTTGVPGAYRVVYSALSPDIERHEREIHQKLDRCRYRNNREFFEIDEEVAKTTVRLVCGGDQESWLAAKIEIERLESENERLRSGAKQLMSRLARSEEIEQRLLSLERDYAQLKKSYTHLENVAELRRKMLDEKSQK